MTLIHDTLKIECLLEAMGDYMEKALAERAARDKFEGTSWGYFGHEYIKAREEAADAFAKRLDEYIDARVSAALEAVKK